jgi:hypothetical protein
MDGALINYFAQLGPQKLPDCFATGRENSIDI